MAEEKPNHLVLKKHHKIILGSFSSIVIISLIVMGIFLNVLLTRQNLNYNSLNDKIDELKTDTQSKFNELTQTVISTQEDLNSLDSQLGTIDKEFNVLKASTSADFSGIIEDAIQSVVTIRTDISQGTGFIIDSEGYVVTNYHVVDGAKSAGVYTYDGKSHLVSLIGFDKNLDVALLKIEGNYDAFELANSNQIQIGEKVIAIGNPLGLQFSVSEGIISAVHRPGPSGENVYIQTDTALNPGNSGGPLINTEGKVVGINNFKVGGGESLGFALESNTIEETINNIAMGTLNQTLI
ncbi:MAG: trypsin-like peptidase domain-containing protein [Nanoarchaeota archaeon]